MALPQLFRSWFRSLIPAAVHPERIAAEERALHTTTRVSVAEQETADLLYKADLLSELNRCESTQSLGGAVLESLRVLIHADLMCLTLGTVSRGLKVHRFSGEVPPALDAYRTQRFQRQAGGAIWTAIETGRVVYVNDYHAPDMPAPPLQPGMPEAVAHVPFGQLDGETGILSAFRTEQGKVWSARERSLLEFTAESIGHLLQRSERHLEFSRMASYADALTQVNQLMEQPLPLDETAVRALKLIAEPGDVDLGAIVRLGGEMLDIQVHYQSERVTPRLLRLIEQGLPGSLAVEQEVQSNEPLFIDIFADMAGPFQPFADAGVSSIAFVPWLDGEAGGLVLVVARLGDARPWSPRDRELFVNAANTIRLSHERQVALNTLSEAAGTDALTGLGNRRALELALRVGLTEAREIHSALHVISLDLDGLKKVNDTEGHDRGDALLVCLAMALRSTFRDGDTVFRVGGDEFVVLVKSAGPVSRALEGVCSRISDVGERLRNSGVGFQDVSAGIATFPVDGEEGRALLRVSDERMYLQKQEHRRRVAE
jgi:diguanylate cyclase (GGDEF)-like protein